MLQSKFIKVYQTLSKVEVRRFRKWLKSPVHNQHKKVIKMLDYVGSRSVISAKTLAKERVFKHLFQTEYYNEHKLNHIISYTYQNLIEFLGYNRLILNEQKTKILQIQALRERQLPNLTQQLLKNTQQNLTQQTLRNGQYYLHVWELEKEQMTLRSLSNRNASNNLPAIFESLSNFFMISTLHYACIAISHTQVHKTAYSIPFLKQILETIETAEQELPVVLSTYYYAYMALKNPNNSTYFVELKKVFWTAAPYMDREEQKDILLMAINYCIRSLNQQSNPHAASEALELYQYGLEHKILIDHGILSKYAFNNMVSLGLKEKRFDWVENFIQTYATALEPSYQQSHKHYNTAKLFFAQQNYDQVLELLVYVEYDDILMNIDAKVMLVKIYYQYQYFDTLDALLNSFTVFLQRKSMLSYHRDNYIQFIQLTKRLLYLAAYDKKGRAQLRKDIEDAQPLTERAWLLQNL